MTEINPSIDPVPQRTKALDAHDQNPRPVAPKGAQVASPQPTLVSADPAVEIDAVHAFQVGDQVTALPLLLLSDGPIDTAAQSAASTHLVTLPSGIEVQVVLEPLDQPNIIRPEDEDVPDLRQTALLITILSIGPPWRGDAIPIDAASNDATPTEPDLLDDGDEARRPTETVPVAIIIPKSASAYEKPVRLNALPNQQNQISTTFDAPTSASAQAAPFQKSTELLARIVSAQPAPIPNSSEPGAASQPADIQLTKPLAQPALAQLSPALSEGVVALTAPNPGAISQLPVGSELTLISPDTVQISDATNHPLDAAAPNPLFAAKLTVLSSGPTVAPTFVTAPPPDSPLAKLTRQGRLVVIEVGSRVQATKPETPMTGQPRAAEDLSIKYDVQVVSDGSEKPLHRVIESPQPIAPRTRIAALVTAPSGQVKEPGLKHSGIDAARETLAAIRSVLERPHVRSGDEAPLPSPVPERQTPNAVLSPLPEAAIDPLLEGQNLDTSASSLAVSSEAISQAAVAAGMGAVAASNMAKDKSGQITPQRQALAQQITAALAKLPDQSFSTERSVLFPNSAPDAPTSLLFGQIGDLVQVGQSFWKALLIPWKQELGLAWVPFLSREQDPQHPSPQGGENDRGEDANAGSGEGGDPGGGNLEFAISAPFGDLA
ncbi:MAG: hypothetical protein AAGF15_09125, partial [Pseudomonadota bacterium]